MAVKHNLLLTIDEAAEELRMSPGYVKKAIREGRIRKVKLGSAVRVEYSEIERYVASLRVGDTVGSPCDHEGSPKRFLYIQALDSIAGDF